MWGSKKPQKKVYSGFYGDCSPQQLQALQKFRTFVNKLSNNQINQKWDDYYLLRFLRARKFVSEDVEKMWTNFIEWRKANDVDNAIVCMVLIKYFKFPELTKIRKEYPHGYHKVDKKFRPIYIQRVGLLNVDQVFKLTSPDRLLKYYAMTYQTLINTIFPGCTLHYQKVTGQPGRIEQTFTILDLKDVKLSQTSKAYNFVKPASQLSQNNYPQILGNMFIINAPFLFTGIWMVVKMWIDDKTKQKIKILGSNYKKQLLEYVDPQNLPTFIDGGKCTCGQGDCLSRNIGPWNPQGLQIYPYSLGIKDRQIELKQQVQLKIKEQKILLQEKQREQMKKMNQIKQEKLVLENKQKNQANKIGEIKQNEQQKEKKNQMNINQNKQIVKQWNLAQNQINSSKQLKIEVKQALDINNQQKCQKVDTQLTIQQKKVSDLKIENNEKVSDPVCQNVLQVSQKENSFQGTTGELLTNKQENKPQV